MGMNSMNKLQEWVIETLQTINGWDTDHASQKNDIGFNKIDGPTARSLLSWFSAREFFTQKQWALAHRLAIKYRRQANSEPPEGDLDEGVQSPPAAEPAHILIDLCPQGTGVVTKAVGRLQGDLFKQVTDLLRQHRFRFLATPAPHWLCWNKHIDKQWAATLNHSAIRFSPQAQVFLASLRDPVPSNGTWTYTPHIPPGARPYQREGIEWLHRQKSGILGDDMGLGKTLQTLGAVDASWPVLIVAPLAAKFVWPNEVKKWRPDLRASVVKSPKDFRWPEPGEVVVCNYEQLPRLASEPSKKSAQVLELLTPTMPASMVLVAEEAHMLKNHKAQRSVRFKSLRMLNEQLGGRTWAITGTPVLNRAMELYGILQAIGSFKTVFPGGWKQFQSDLDARIGRWGTEWGPCINKELPSRMKAVMLRRTRAEVFPQCPPKIYQPIPVEPSRDLANKLNRYMEELEGRYPNLTDSGEFLDKVMAGGLDFETISKLKTELSMAKTPAALELVEEWEEEGTPVCVCSAHRFAVDELAKRPGWASITGDTPAHVRDEIVQQFQAGKLKGVAFTIKAGGVGITLTAATRMLFVDLEWTPALNLQAEDRLRPHLQTESCVYVQLQIDHPLERRIYEALTSKTELIKKII